MIYFSVKNPLESETVGQRRERKAKESEGSLYNSKSSASIKETKSVKAKRFSIFGTLSKTPKIPKAASDASLKITVTQTVGVVAAELEAPRDLPSPTSIFSGPLPPSRGYSELSASPSVSRPRIRESPSFRRAHDTETLCHEERQKSWYDEMTPSSKAEYCSELNGTTADIALNDAQLPSAAPMAMLDRKQSDPSRPHLPMSSCSTLRSESIFQPKSILGEELQSPIDFTPVSPEPRSDTVINILPALSSTPEVYPISLSAPTSPALIEKSIDTGNASDMIQEETKALQDVLATSNSSIPWQLSLRIMERASNQILCQRLAENWEGIESDLREHIEFEKRLWALNALKRLDGGLGNQKGRPGMGSFPVEGPKGRELTVIQICGIGAEAWDVATTNPQYKVCCLSSIPEPRWPWGAPPNLDSQVWWNSPSLPYEDGSVDIVSSRSIVSMLRSHDWPPFLRDCARVLKPRGILDISILDPMPRNAGPLLQQWTTAHLILGLERRFSVTRPAMVIPLWLEDVSQFTLPHVKTVTFSAVSNDDTDVVDAVGPGLMGSNENHPCRIGMYRRRRSNVQQLKTAVGRHFYQALYKELAFKARSRRSLIPGVDGANEIIRHWWWKDPAIVRECREYGTMFEMVTYTCLKRGSIS